MAIDSYMQIGGSQTLAESIENLPDGSLDFVYASFDEVGNTLTISSIPENEKLTTDIISEDSTVVTTNTNVETSLLDVMKTKDTNLTSHLAQQNDYLKKQNDLVAEQNKINVELVNSIKEQNKILTSTFNLMVLNSSKQELQGNYNIAKNSMTMDKLDFEMYGKPDFKDTEQNLIIPQEQKAKYHAEKRIDEEKANKVDLSKITNDIEDDSDIDTNIMNDVISSMFDSVDMTKIPKTLEEL